jgi:peptide/nickel transport system permease protein
MPEDYFEQTFASQLAQGTITKDQLQEMKDLYHLGDSTFMGILGGYWDWLTDVFKGDLGISLKYGKPVADVIVQNMGISFGISLVAMVLEYIIAIPLGIKAACNQYGKIDYTVTVLTMMGISLPTFFLAALLIQVFAVNLGWFPVSGLASANLSVDASAWTRFWDVAWHLFLPMLTLVILSIGGLMRHTRTNMLEVLNADYIRTARAKGLSERSVIYKHAFKNTMIPIVTMTAGIIPSLFGGAMITETVFGIPGIGKLAYDAMKVGDVPFIMGYNMFLAVLTVLGTLLSDLMYVLVDPRVKLTK